VAGEINPYLIALVAGLVILNLTCLVGLVVSNLPVMHISPSCLTSMSSSKSSVGAVTPRGANAAVPDRQPRSG
jgi:hypothetical protein